MKIRLSLCWIAISIVFLSLGCNRSQNPVNLFGEKVDLQLFEGEWKGDYFSKDTGRSGTIEFMLSAEEGRAFGDVLMIPRGSREPYHPVGFKDKADLDPQFPEFLTINFVEVMGGKVKGELTPYWDPEMQRRMVTTFEGVLKGNTIEGTFESRIEQSPIYFYGQWKVYRKKIDDIG
ncbi:MAG: hypothetical protein JSV17_02505 [Candidatus Aminicenantes bacterium]|nr:MAG: hypothetical protein JSV17_02505 [Candidatus Aminicenantes bacterium]